MLRSGMGNAVLAPVSEVLARLVVEAARTALAAKDVLIEKESFTELSRYLQKITPILHELMDKNVSDTRAMREALAELEEQMQKAQELIKKCSSKSRFYLLVNCRTFVKEIQDITREIGRCLSLIPMANLEIGVETRDKTAKLYNNMQRAQFKAAVAEEAIIEQIDSGVRDRQTDSEYANGLLMQIARAVGVPTDPTSLKEELDNFKKEKEDAQDRKNQQESFQLEQIIGLLSRADAATSVTEKDANYRRRRGPGERVGHPVPALQSFYCPITQEVMEEPVEVASGQTFEKSAIEKWFAAGHHTCPTTKVELDTLEIKLNLALRQSIQEWKERNTAISIAATKPKLLSRNENEISSALRTLIALSEEKGTHRYWIASEGLIPVLVELLKDSPRNVRKEILELLRSIAVDNRENKEKIAAEDAIRLVVRSLARDVGEGRQAVALLLELSKDPKVCEKIGKVQGCILLLVTMLNSENPQAVEDARALLQHLSNNDQNVVQMAEANHFRPLTQRLSEGTDMTKILMASALSRMGLTDQSKATLAQQGVIPPLVKMISVGKLEAKGAALGALQNLSTLPENREPMIQAGVIPPLLQLLFSVTSVVMNLKVHAAATLANLAMASTTAETKIDNNGNILESDETIFQLLSLLNLAGTIIQGHLLRALLGMSSLPSASEVRGKMREGGAIQLLLPFCEVPENDVRIHALKLLNCLSCDGAGKELADHLGTTYIKVLLRLLDDSRGDDERAAAVGIIGNLPAGNTMVTDLLLQANALPAIVNLLEAAKGSRSTSRVVRNLLTESAAVALLRFTASDNVKLQKLTVDLDAIPRLVQLLQTGTPLAKFRAASALGQLSESSLKLTSQEKPQNCFIWCKPPADPGCTVHGGHCSVRTSFCLVQADAIGPLVQTLEEKEGCAAEAALYALSTLLQDGAHLENAVKVIADAQGIRHIVRLLTAGSLGAKGRAVWILEKIFRIERYKSEFGSAAQMPLIDLTQRGTSSTRPLAAKILAHLNILHNQSTYF